jgi:hypothetical protein
MEALLLAVVEIVEGAKNDLKVASELFFSEEKRGAGRSGALIAGDLEQFRLLAAKTGHKGIAEIADELAG